MRLDFSDGVVIEGDAEELRGLAEDIERASWDDKPSEALMLTADGVERVLIRRTEALDG